MTKLLQPKIFSLRKKLEKQTVIPTILILVIDTENPTSHMDSPKLNYSY